MMRIGTALAFTAIGFASLVPVSCSSPEADSGPGSVSGRRDGVGSIDTRVFFEATGSGTLRGRVVLDGPIPAMKPIDVSGHFDAPHCHTDRLKDRTWVVDPDTRGVANVVVWLRPPRADQAFPRPSRGPDNQPSWEDRVVIDQPHCMFEPRVVVLYPEYLDADKKKVVPTGQRLFIRNSAEIRHNATLQGSNTRNPKQERMLGPRRSGGAVDEVSLKLRPDDRPIELTCLLHRWMKGYIWAFDHPYATVTDAEGRFEIRHAPAGAEVHLRVWHEDGIAADLTRGGEPITIPVDGVLERDITLQRRE